MKKLAVVVACVVLLGLAPIAQAAPLTFTVTYVQTSPCTHWNGCVPDFSFSFELPDFVTTTGTFLLPAPVSFDTGLDPDGVPAPTVPVIQSFAGAGTNTHGIWLFGTSFNVGDDGWGGSFGPGPILELLNPSVDGYITAPTTTPITFLARGNTMAPPGTNEPFQYSFQGTATLTVTNGAVPEPVSLLLVGTGIAGMAARRRRTN